MANVLELILGIVFLGIGIGYARAGKLIKTGHAFQRREPWHVPGPRQQIALRILLSAIATILVFDALNRMLKH